MDDILLEQDTRLVFDRSKLKTIDLWSSAVKYDPGAIWMEWATTPPFFVEVGGAPQAVVTRYEDAKIAFEDARYIAIHDINPAAPAPRMMTS